MDKKEIQKLIRESLSSFKEDVSAEDQMMDTDEFENSLGSGEEDYEDEDINLGLEPIPMSAIDMPIQDKAIFNTQGGNQSYDDEFSDLNGYREFGDGTDDYEGNWQDDVSVSPGYFNENEDDMDPIAIAKTNAMSGYDPTQDAMDYAGVNWKLLSPQEKDEIMADMENDKRRAMGENLELTTEELQEVIKEGVERLHRKTLIENRLEQINNELNMINNPEAWESARTEAKNQLAKKTIAWNNISTREDLLSEMSFRDIKLPVSKPIDTATVEANSKWDNLQKESVSDIMGRAADLMAEAKKKYNDISK